MKKWLIYILLFLILVSGSIYLLVPGKLDLTGTEGIKASPQAILRILRNDDKWPLWWPGKVPGNNHGFSIGTTALYFHDFDYRIKKNIFGGFEIEIQDSASSINSLLIILPISKDSSTVEWQSEMITGTNPFHRIPKYWKAKELARDINHILSSMKSFVENRTNVYDMPIEETKVTDTLLISSNTSFSHNPSTLEIYDLFQKLENYANALGAKRTNPPMLHVERTSNNTYKVVVAIPIDKILPNKGNFTFKRMVPGNILVGEVQGGASRIKNGFSQLDSFMHDYQKSGVAIQFESLVTDRQKEPDTTKWITRLYYPIY